MHPLLLSCGQWIPAPAKSVSGNLIQEEGIQFSKEPSSEMRHGGELPLKRQEQKQKFADPTGLPGSSVWTEGQVSDSSAHLTPPRDMSTILGT